MKAVVRFFAYIIIAACLVGFLAASATAEPKGQDFPNTKCTCKGCGTNGGDVTGQCSSVCKDKTVYSKGSEPYDYCKAALVRPGGRVIKPPAGGMLSR